MTQSRTPQRPPVNLPTMLHHLPFDAGRLTSDGGLAWIAQADAALGLCAALAGPIRDWRRGPVQHALVNLVRQRVFQITCGYEDQDDADTLRRDPLLKWVCGRRPESGADLASQPTLSRLENAVNVRTCHRLAAALGGIYRQERERLSQRQTGGPPTHILLDLDGTDDPTHGEQEGIAYTIGLSTNARLEAVAAPLLAEAQRQHQQTGEKVRLASETAYAAESWPPARQVVYKAEALAKGPNTRFVVTTRTDAPLTLYKWHVQRGTPEQWIDDLKNGCFADRLSCHRFWANQFRLLLHAAAYWLLDTLRRWLMQAGLPRLELGTLRLRLVKIGGWVRERVRGVAIHLASSHPGESLWRLLASRFPHL